MENRSPLRESRIFSSPNRFKLATFGFNSQGGVTITSAPGTPDTDWGQQVRIAQLSDAADIEAIIPGARWMGFGGKTNFQGRSYETMTWASGLAALTRKTQVFATVHFTTVHPVRLAKMIATADHISGGRLGINWVAGWNTEEISMFGGTQREHDERYEYAEEYLALLNQLLDRDGSFDFHGRYFDLERLFSEPKPIQAPRPIYMAAGLSPRGRQFAGQEADINFVPARGPMTDVAALVADTKSKAKEKGREIMVFGQSVVVCRDSEAEAKDYYDWYVNEMGDFEAAENLVRGLFGNTINEHGQQREMPEHIHKAILRSCVGAHGGNALVGTPTQVVEAFARMADTGVDGSTISWLNFEEGLVQFREKILPLMIEAGLRTDESAGATHDQSQGDIA